MCGCVEYVEYGVMGGRRWERVRLASFIGFEYKCLLGVSVWHRLCRLAKRPFHHLKHMCGMGERLWELGGAVTSNNPNSDSDLLMRVREYQEE